MSDPEGLVSFGRHALDILAERGIERAWVEHTLRAPEAVENDPRHAGRMRAFRAIPERGGRVLRVVYVSTGDALHVITCFLDRGRRR
ncbi:MAG TPA: DUF4258 domain-containing protein [Microvirga sp.]|jgi:hypothetical protein|nr:DUF4258 domain-containing protein [Microvirga sp.]